MHSFHHARSSAARDVRTATHADIPRLVEIRAAVRENRLSDPSRVTLADYAWFIDNAAIHVFDADGIRGFSAGDPRDGTIWALFVDPVFEGLGIGQMLIAAACAALRAAGHATATLRTEAGTRAARFYRRNGWIERPHSSNIERLFEKKLVD